MTVHPRVRGELLIPRSPTPPWGHPRVRGEHCKIPHGATIVDGSSPRARGTLCDTRISPLQQRFIPACAGNTSWLAKPQPVDAVHPRVRGEHVRRPLRRLRVYGSSPRARGTPFQDFLIGGFLRFIPACAGNTRSPSRSLQAIKVHPRVRGEHFSSRAPARAASTTT